MISCDRDGSVGSRWECLRKIYDVGFYLVSRCCIVLGGGVFVHVVSECWEAVVGGRMEGVVNCAMMRS